MSILLLLFCLFEQGGLNPDAGVVGMGPYTLVIPCWGWSYTLSQYLPTELHPQPWTLVLFSVFEMKFCSVAQASLKLKVFLLQSPEY